MLMQRPRPAHRHHRPRRPRVLRKIAAVVLALFLATASLSYVQALTYPGNASWQVRTVEWVRDHGGSGTVNVVENWWYAHNAPTGTAPAPGSVPLQSAGADSASGDGPAPAPLPLLPGAAPLPGEGQWVPSPQRVRGAPVLYTGYFRPDPSYPSQVVGAAWVNQTVASTHLIAGTREPTSGGPGQAQVTPAMRPTLVAAFNSGWKMKDINGGFYVDGHTVLPLRDGAASLVIDKAGRVTVGQWGRDVTMTPQVSAVRQNLALVIDGGQAVPGLSDNAAGDWGSPRNQFQYTWRSGVGTDQAGNLVYVAGDKLTLAGLAHAMVQAGVQRGMELDIHPGMVTFNTFHRSPGGYLGLAAAKLLPGMPQPATRYLNPDQRDFFAVTAGPASPSPRG